MSENYVPYIHVTEKTFNNKFAGLSWFNHRSRIKSMKGVVTMSDTIIAALIGFLAAIVVEIIRLYFQRKNKKSDSKDVDTTVRFLEPSENFREVLNDVSCLRMYTVNSYELLGQVNTILEQNVNIVLNKVEILVRKKVDESEEDLKSLDTIITIWDNWVKKGRIKELTIVGYDHDPDHYYSIIGDKFVFAGQVFFDETKPTGTSVNYLPLVFGGDTSIGKQVIKNYHSHFDNVMKKYKGNSLYLQGYRS